MGEHDQREAAVVNRQDVDKMSTREAVFAERTN